MGRAQQGKSPLTVAAAAGGAAGAAAQERCLPHLLLPAAAAHGCLLLLLRRSLRAAAAAGAACQPGGGCTEMLGGISELSWQQLAMCCRHAELHCGGLASLTYEKATWLVRASVQHLHLHTHPDQHQPGGASRADLPALNRDHQLACPRHLI